MKVLVLSLHRIGDFFMHTSLIPNIREKYKASHISVLLNDQIFKSVEDFPVSADGINELLTFPRKALQDELVLRKGSVLAAHHQLSSHLHSLRGQGFDLCIDLTHSNVSRLIGESLGLPFIGPPRDSYLNEFFDIPNLSRFHYMDAMTIALGTRTKNISARQSGSKKFLVQLTTSDTKKNYPLPNYLEFLMQVQLKNPDLQFEVVCAAAEERELSRILSGSDISLRACNWPELATLLPQSAGLISVDTATIHLAAKLGVWCFGIYLGSADPSKTSPYGDGHILVQSTVPCAPCFHRGQCEKAAHECSDQLQPGALAEVFSLGLRNEKQKLMDLSYQLPFQVFQTYFDPNNFFALREFADDNSALRGELARCAHEPRNSDWNRLADRPHWLIYDLLAEKEVQFKRIDSWLVSIDRTLTALAGDPKEIPQLLDLCQEFINYNDAREWCGWLSREMAEARVRPSAEFPQRIRYFYTKFINYLTIEKQILKNLVVLNAKKGAFYVSGPPGAA